MRVTVTLAATLVTLSLVTAFAPTALAGTETLAAPSATVMVCHDGEVCDDCRGLFTPGSVEDKVRECLNG